MRNAAIALVQLFKKNPKLSSQLVKNLFDHGVMEVAIKAAGKIPLTIKGRRIMFSDLSKDEQDVIKEAVKFSYKMADSYVEHHAECENRRQQPMSAHEYLADHFQEILNATMTAAYSRAKSHAYDGAFGKPTRTSIFMEEDITKQMVSAVISDAEDHAVALVQEQLKKLQQGSNNNSRSW